MGISIILLILLVEGFLISKLDSMRQDELIREALLDKADPSSQPKPNVKNRPMLKSE